MHYCLLVQLMQPRFVPSDLQAWNSLTADAWRKAAATDCGPDRASPKQKDLR